MSRNLLTSAIDYLATASTVKIAHLVRLELTTSTEESKVYIYLTDYTSDVTWDGKVYQAGRVSRVGDVRQTTGITNYKLSITVAGEFKEELDRALVENTNESYVGREIQVLRAFLDDTDSIIPFDKDTNGPMQYFIGDITNVNVSEGVVSGNSTVTWECAGKFSDFEKVNGRITDDKSHRGLETDTNQFLEDGVTPNPNYGKEVPGDGARVPAHQTDTGFQHAARSVDLVSKYTTKETRYKLKKSWFGLKTSLKEYQVDVERTVELGIDLSAKYLPKVYGVRKVPGIPVFVDTLKNNPSVVYVVYAFCEGPIDAFLNFYLDGQSLICSSAEESNSELCLGNQANGDTVSAFMSNSAQPDINAIEEARYRSYYSQYREDYVPLLPPPTPTFEDRIGGTRHAKNGTSETVYKFSITGSTGVKQITAFHGYPDQNAAQELVSIAAAGNFAGQAEWAVRTGRPASEYWDNNTRLLNTAYIVYKFSITEEETTLPEIDAVVSGSLVSTYDEFGNETPNQYTLNPVWQLLDYMTDPICGGGLPKNVIDFKSFKQVADIMDSITESYENNFLTYWRYLGWKLRPSDPASEALRTFMQTNVVLETSNTVTSNIESLLNQFDGTINILGGKYHLSVETDDAPVADIDISEVIGSITTKDQTSKDKWNSIQANIVDPAKGWSSTQINFFNSEYLSQDKGVQNKGNVSFPYITNYYTAREWAQRQLNKSRYSRKITLTTYYKYCYLFPNSNVTLRYPRFWGDTAKKFRVSEITLKSDGKVSLFLEDYDSDVFSYTKSQDESGENNHNPSPSPLPPTNLEYIKLPNPSYPYAVNEDDTYGLLVWDPSPSPSIIRYDVRDWKEESGDYTVPISTIILKDGTDVKHYIPIKGLEVGNSYRFKVRALDSSGKYSKYAVLYYTAGSSDVPVGLAPVGSFWSDNVSSDGMFSGSQVTVKWTSSPSPRTSTYEIQVLAEDSTTVLRSVLLDTTYSSYTYGLVDNMQDYNTNTGKVGAYRKFTFRIRATNGYSEGDPNFTYSEWVYIT
jgi:hypothetical protein